MILKIVGGRRMAERYEVHSMIAGMDIGEQMDLEVCKSLIKEYGSLRDIELLITDNGIDMTYGEVADQLNRYHKREEILKQSDSINDLTLSILDLQEKLKEVKEERDYFERKKCEYFNKYNKKHLANIQLREENEQLKQTIENICKDYKESHSITIH